MKKFTAALFALFGLAPVAAFAADDVMIVYDGSNSMWGQIDGVAKIEIARDVMADLVGTWPQSTNLGLLAYGHRREGDCTDIEMLVAPGPVDKASFLETVNAIVPRGRTPLTDAVEQAAERLAYRDNPATVVLLSDGVETCQADPCTLATRLEQQGVAFTTHVIGFDLSREEHQQLSCIAENTGGVFVPAENADELRGAMSQVQEVIEAEVEPEPEPEPEPQQTVELTAPASVVAGTFFDVAWSAALNPRDIVLIAPAGSDDDAYVNYVPVRTDKEGQLTAPAEPGLYEVRYQQREGRTVLTSVPVEVVAAEVSLTAPASVVTGAFFDVAWSEALNPRDIVLIAPAGSDDDAYVNYVPVRTDKEGQLTAPAEPGLYEVRYQQREGRTVLTSTPIEIVDAEVTLTAPDLVRAETDVEISWEPGINPRDLVLIAPAGSDAQESVSYAPVRSDSSATLAAPSQPGLYEVRYILKEGRKIIAAVPLEVVPADAPLDDGAGLTAPATAAAGDTITVSWTIAAADADRRVTLAMADAPDFTWIEAKPVGAGSEAQFTLPDEPGQYEVRFLDLSNQTVLGRAIVAVE